MYKNYNLQENIVDLLKALSKEQGVTVTEALTRAILTEAFIKRELSHGSKIFVQKEGVEGFQQISFLS